MLLPVVAIVVAVVRGWVCLDGQRIVNGLAQFWECGAVALGVLSRELILPLLPHVNAFRQVHGFRPLAFTKTLCPQELQHHRDRVILILDEDAVVRMYWPKYIDVMIIIARGQRNDQALGSFSHLLHLVS